MRRGVATPTGLNTPYVNTIPVDEQAEFPGNRDIERRIKSIMRWNAMAMVARGHNGGHISTYASAATLYEIGFNHFFKGPDAPGGGDSVFIQGHASPGIYARAFLEGRIYEAPLNNLSPRISPRRRAFELSASVADARFLGIPDGVDGPGADHGHLSGPL